MSDPSIPSSQPDPSRPWQRSGAANDSAPSEHSLRRRRRGFVAGFAIGGILVGLAGFAIGAATPAAEAALGAFARHHDGPTNPAEAREHAEFFVSFALHRLDASDAQEDAVQKRVGAAIDELFPLVDQHRGNRDELRSLLGAASIDRAALEALRAEELALADAMSRVVVAAVADSAETLTPAQRAELAERIGRFHRHH